MYLYIVSINQKTNAISIEHTHPGASFVVHGQRWLAQNKLKDLWKQYQDLVKQQQDFPKKVWEAKYNY